MFCCNNPISIQKRSVAVNNFNLVLLLIPYLKVQTFIHYICCCSAYLSSCHQTASDTNLLDDPLTFHYNDYFVIGGICTCLGVFDDPMFLWISSNSCPLNLLLVRSHQAEIIIIKRLTLGHNNVTRVRVEPRPFDQGRRKNDASFFNFNNFTQIIKQRFILLIKLCFHVLLKDKHYDDNRKKNSTNK